MTSQHYAQPDSLRTYAIVWLCLLAFTAITVAAASLNLGKLAIAACLAIATIKSILVFLYFMHLRHESRLAIKLAIPIAITVLAIFIGLTFTDVLAR